MEKLELEDLSYLSICQQCGCVFSMPEATRDWGEEPRIVVCPACHSQYEVYY